VLERFGTTWNILVIYLITPLTIQRRKTALYYITSRHHTQQSSDLFPIRQKREKTIPLPRITKRWCVIPLAQKTAASAYGQLHGYGEPGMDRQLFAHPTTNMEGGTKKSYLLSSSWLTYNSKL